MDAPQAAQQVDPVSQEDYYTAPRVLFVVGNSLRRLHTVSMLAHMLDELQISFACFYSSLSQEEFSIFAERFAYVHGHIAAYRYAGFKEQYVKFQKPSKTPCYIIIEMNFDFLSKISFAEHEVQSLLLTDFSFLDADTPEDLEQRIIAQMKRTPSLQSMVYHFDMQQYSSTAQKRYLLQVEDIPIRTHYSFGRTVDSMIQLIPQEHSLILTMPNMQCAVPYDNQMTKVAEEGYFAALALLASERVLTSMQTITRPALSPWLEDMLSPKRTIMWGAYIQEAEEMNAILDKHQFLCVSMSIYLRFEQVIENRITEVGQIFVVPERDDQEVVFGEYFVQKEKDSYHTIIYVPEKQLLEEVLHSMGGEHTYCMVFDDLEIIKIFLK